MFILSLAKSTSQKPDNGDNKRKQRKPSYSEASEISLRQLRQNCSYHRLMIFGRMPKDGNCFFHAVISQLILQQNNNEHAVVHDVTCQELLRDCQHRGEDQAAQKLRKNVINFMRENPDLPVILRKHSSLHVLC